MNRTERFLRPYLHLAGLRLKVQFAYRVEAFAGVFSTLIPLVTSVFLWKCAFRNTGSVRGVSEQQMVTYAILAIVLKDVFYCSIQDSIARGVRSGDIALDLARPLNPMLRFLAEDVAMSVATFVRRLTPILLLSALLLPPPFPVDFPSGLIAFISGCLRFTILWSLSALAGLTAFWWIDIGGLGMVKDAIVRILSGSLVPIWFFPSWYQRLSHYLPFEHSYQTMLGIYVGRTPWREAGGLLAIQMGWGLLLTLSVGFIWRRARRHILIQGG